MSVPTTWIRRHDASSFGDYPGLPLCWQPFLLCPLALGGPISTQHDTALKLAGSALEKKAIDPVVLYVEPLLGYCSHFLIVGGSNSRQVRAIAGHVLSEAKKMGVTPLSSEGRSNGKWVLLDFGDVVVHVFDQDQRGFYDLEGLWADAEVVEIPGVEPRHPAAQAWV